MAEYRRTHTDKLVNVRKMKSENMFFTYIRVFTFSFQRKIVKLFNTKGTQSYGFFLSFSSTCARQPTVPIISMCCSDTAVAIHCSAIHIFSL